METENKDSKKQTSTIGNWLLKYRKYIFSQFGEDGIIEKIFSVLPNTSRWCVAFGAWDGKHLIKNFICNYFFGSCKKDLLKESICAY